MALEGFLQVTPLSKQLSSEKKAQIWWSFFQALSMASPMETWTKVLFVFYVNLPRFPDSKVFMADNTKIPKGKVIDLPPSSSAPHMDLYQLTQQIMTLTEAVLAAQWQLSSLQNLPITIQTLLMSIAPVIPIACPRQCQL